MDKQANKQLKAKKWPLGEEKELGKGVEEGGGPKRVEGMIDIIKEQNTQGREMSQWNSLICAINTYQ
jgi:hypothetical protein